MIDTVRQFFAMGGYGYYVWSAYAAVFACLTIQWLLPFRRLRRYLRQQKTQS